MRVVCELMPFELKLAKNGTPIISHPSPPTHSHLLVFYWIPHSFRPSWSQECKWSDFPNFARFLLWHGISTLRKLAKSFTENINSNKYFFLFQDAPFFLTIQIPDGYFANGHFLDQIHPRMNKFNYLSSSLNTVLF